MSFSSIFQNNSLNLKYVLKDRYTLFFIINCVILASILFVLFLSIFYAPLPYGIFITLAYGSFCYFLILLFKLIEKNMSSVQKICSHLHLILSKKFYFFITGFLVFVILLFIFFIIIPIESKVVDVDQAVITGVQSFSNGINPYIEKVIPHSHKKIDYANFSNGSTNNIIFGTYNYLPADLLFYSVGYFLFSPFIGYFWYYVTNFLALCFCIGIFAYSYSLSIFKSILLFFPAILLGVIVLNDIWLVVFFILFLIWVDKHKYDENHTKIYYLISVTLLTLGFLTKMLLIFILPVFLLYTSKNWFERIIYSLYSAILSLIFISFFSFYAVINSVILFNSNINTRAEIAFIGGVLAPPLQVLNLTILYVPIFILIYFSLLYLSRFYSPSLEGRILFVTLITIVLLPSGDFLPTIWCIFISGVYVLYSNFIEKPTSPEVVIE